MRLREMLEAAVMRCSRVLSPLLLRLLEARELVLLLGGALVAASLRGRPGSKGPWVPGLSLLR